MATWPRLRFSRQRARPGSTRPRSSAKPSSSTSRCRARSTTRTFRWGLGRDLAVKTVDAAQAYLMRERPNLMFVHLADADFAGHIFGWMSRPYGWAVQSVDYEIGELLRSADRACRDGDAGRTPLHRRSVAPPISVNSSVRARRRWHCLPLALRRLSGQVAWRRIGSFCSRSRRTSGRILQRSAEPCKGSARTSLRAALLRVP